MLNPDHCRWEKSGIQIQVSSGRNFQFDFISFDIIKTVSTLDKKKYKICSLFKSEI